MSKTYITKHFYLEEFLHSDTAALHDIPNTPTQEVLDNIKVLANELEKIRTTFGKPMIITSGYRCTKLNQLVGGKSTSQHVDGSACDFVCRTKGELKEVWDLIKEMVKRNEIHFRQIINEKDLSWVHIAVNDTNHSNKDNQILYL